jgi:LCP family protein required for cell wall assembly
LGSDSRAFITSAADRARYADPAQAEGERADLVALLRVPDAGPSRLLVIPRDLLLTTGGSFRRLTTSLMSGPGNVATSLCAGLGVGTDHVLVLDFPGLISLVDAVGGISVTTDAPLRDLKSKLSLSAAGKQQLAGESALAYVRARHLERNLDGSWRLAPDLNDRAPRLLAVLRQLGEQAVRNPVAAQRVAWAIGPHLRADDDLGAGDLIHLATGLRSAAQANRVKVLPADLKDGKVPVALRTVGSDAELESWLTPSCTQETP